MPHAMKANKGLKVKLHSFLVLKIVGDDWYMGKDHSWHTT
jgi:hypothetical protein